MNPMKNKFLLVPFILLLGCDPLGRLTGTSTKKEDTTAATEAPQPVYYEGNFYGKNFVDVDFEDMKTIDVWIQRKKKWIALEGYTAGQKTKDPYYITSKTSVIFFNIRQSDLYSIRITK